MNTANKTIVPAPIRKSVRVGAPPERAFKVFTDDIGRWWPKTHHIVPADLDAPVIEPKAGGRWYEPRRQRMRRRQGSSWIACWADSNSSPAIVYRSPI